MRNPPAAHRFVLGSTRLIVFLMIALLGCGGILLAQRGLFELLGGDVRASWGSALMGVAMIGASVALARFRNDLVDD